MLECLDNTSSNWVNLMPALAILLMIAIALVVDNYTDL